MTAEPERIEVVIVFPGSGPETLRRTVAVFLTPEKIAALRDDPGVLGALLVGAATRRTGTREA